MTYMLDNNKLPSPTWIMYSNLYSILIWYRNGHFQATFCVILLKKSVGHGLIIVPYVNMPSHAVQLAFCFFYRLQLQPNTCFELHFEIKYH